jgi:hypothetical protein
VPAGVSCENGAVPTTPKLPDWFYLARAIVALVAGIAIIWQEAAGDGRVLGYIVGLLLVGLFTPTDVATWRSQNAERSSG